MGRGVSAIGITCPIIKEGDNLESIVLSSIFKTYTLKENDIIGVTESVLARSLGRYVTIDDIAYDIEKKYGKNAKLLVVNPIYSRNRFSLILRGLARACSEIIMIAKDFDEVGNPWGVNYWTGCDIPAYYAEICKEEHCKFSRRETYLSGECENILYCGLHDYNKDWFAIPVKEDDMVYTLADICHDKCDFGLLGSNKADEELLKLFPNSKDAFNFVENLQQQIKTKLNLHVEVLVYGDGCFKDPDTGIWEFADPVAAVGYTKGLNRCANEIKLKYFADGKFKNLQGIELEKAIKQEIRNKESDLKASMVSEGCTPRSFLNILPSLMDLISGSGDRGTPIVVVSDWFTNYATC